MDLFYNAINYFHKDGRYNRTTLGVDSVRGGATLIHWRFTDLVFAGLLLVLYPVVYRLQPFQRQFYVNDLTLLHPFAEHERVPNAALFFYLTWLPLAIVVGVSLVVTKPKNKLYVTYVSALGLVLSVLTASTVTDVLKNAFGRHRPDFLARCVPKEGTPLNTLVYAKDVCTTKDTALLMDGFRTTPLGHLSISFAGLFFLSCWLAGQLALTRPQAGAWRWAVAFLPTLGAGMIALSRTEDYRHHFVDVFVGLLLGVAIALWLYFRLFPLVHAHACYEPRLLQEETLEYEPVEV